MAGHFAEIVDKRGPGAGARRRVWERGTVGEVEGGQGRRGRQAATRAPLVARGHRLGCPCSPLAAFPALLAADATDVPTV